MVNKYEFAIIPALDLMGGKCVRLKQGRKEAVTIYSDDPRAMAKQWVSQGANYLHIVDLDGAFEGKPKNLDKLFQIRDEVSGTLQFGGGLRNQATIEQVLNKGIDFVILGTRAIKDSKFLRAILKRHSARVIVSIDVRQGKVALEGWQKTSRLPAIDLARQLEQVGVKRIVYTDISRDGMLSGPNIEFLVEILEATSLEVIASGGIKDLANIGSLINLDKPNLIGTIVGKALYDQKISLPQALAVARSGVTPPSRPDND